MRRFANLYIVLFLIDAGLSVVDEVLVYYGSSTSMISAVRFPVAFLVIGFSIILFACLGIDRRLPKRIFLPLTLYAFWCSVGLWPLSSVIGFDALPLAASFGQIIVGGFTLVLLQGLGGSFLLRPELFEQEFFSLRNTLGFTAINLLLTPFFLLYTCLAVTGYYLEQQTAGFMRLSPVGIYMAERSYHKNDKVVRLAGMMHIGKETFYKDLAGSMSTKRTIILAEGVTDHDHLLESQFNYNKLAGIIGLSSQETMQIDGNLIDLKDLEAGEYRVALQDKPDIALSDIDLNRFDPITVEFINMLGRTLLGDKPLPDALFEYNLWAEQNMPPERIATVMTDIFDKRNEVVIDNMVRTLKRYDTVIIPWGAMHMPVIEGAVLNRGFRPGDRHERLSLDFRDIPYGELWQKLSKQAGQTP